MKLIRALCDALGFKVETDLDYKEQEIEHLMGVELYNSGGFGSRIPVRRLRASGPDNKIDVDKDGMCVSYLTNPIVSYKLTNKD